MRTTLKQYELIFLFAVTMAAAPRCHAQAQCPWLNAATAAGLLGGEVQTVVSAPNVSGDVTCDFTRNPGPTASTLKIAVHTMANPSKDFSTYLAQCGGTTQPLKAIGNEAVQCISNNTLRKGEEQIIGRVRERAFTISINANPMYRPSSAKPVLSDEARNLAEQVAGALF
jgi:hypothetical protein